MEWMKVSVYTTTQAIESVSGFLLSYGINGLVIEDANDFNEFLNDTTIHWDYIEEDLMQLSSVETNISFYVPYNGSGLEILKEVKSNLPSLRQINPDIDFGSFNIVTNNINEEDWETAWKKYYHPINIGEGLVVVPSWEEYQNSNNKKIITLDPGMAFGTGTHETTRLCMELLEKSVKKDDRFLDVGTGSGILSITAALLGAKEIVGVDIDPLAVSIANKNAKLNNIDYINFIHGDLTKEVFGTFDLVCANIVADVIIRMSKDISIFLKDDGILLVSGIINERCDDVLNALLSIGLKHEDTIMQNDWVAMKFRK